MQVTLSCKDEIWVDLYSYWLSKTYVDWNLLPWCVYNQEVEVHCLLISAAL